MPKTIDDMIKEVQNDPDPAHTLHNKLQDQAIALILTAVDKTEWEDLMKNFVDDNNSAQLARLKLQDSFGQEKYIRKAAAYLVANITCGGATPGRLNERINGILDIGLESNMELASRD